MAIQSMDVRITLRDVEPLVWREVRIDPDMPLPIFHEVLQAAMGWTDSHLHEFETGTERIGIPSEDGIYDVKDERDLVVRDVLKRKRSRLVYLYDFGDGWEHDVVVTATSKQVPEAPARILAGARACPPEDCGGPVGYLELTEILVDPQHERHQEMRHWAGEEFDPEVLDLDQHNALIDAIMMRQADEMPGTDSLGSLLALLGGGMLSLFGEDDELKQSVERLMMALIRCYEVDPWSTAMDEACVQIRCPSLGLENGVIWLGSQDTGADAIMLFTTPEDLELLQESATDTSHRVRSAIFVPAETFPDTLRELMLSEQMEVFPTFHVIDQQGEAIVPGSEDLDLLMATIEGVSRLTEMINGPELLSSPIEEQFEVAGSEGTHKVSLVVPHPDVEFDTEPLVYDPDTDPDVKHWFNATSGHRLDAIMDSHDGGEDTGATVHAVLHLLAENAVLHDRHIRGALDQLMQDGNDRHESIHDIGSSLMEVMLREIPQLSRS